MAIRTLSSQERYSNKNSRGGGTEATRKLKKLKSVKVANLDRLRLSMRREKTRFNPGSSSESSSSPMSGKYSPNYMKATTSSSARKASKSSDRTPERRNSPASRGKSSKKFNNVPVEQYSDSIAVNIPVGIKSAKNLKRVSSMKKTKKLSTMKSMKIRAKYSQFPDLGINELGNSSLQIPEFEDNAGVSDDQGGMIMVEPKQRGLLQRSVSRSRSMRLMRLKSIRSSRRLKSRLGVKATVQTSFEAERSNAEPHYMKPTSSQESRKYSAKGLTRTSSLRPLRILAKIPSLRQRRSKVRVNRGTCSSVLKSSKFPNHIELKSAELQTGIPSFHVCPYNYCSLHGHHNNAPARPLRDFISAKRQSINNQKDKQLENISRESIIHCKSATETNQLEQLLDSESSEAKEAASATTPDVHEIEDTGVDFLANVYAKPRKKWDIEGNFKEDAEALHGSNCIELNYYERRVEDKLSEASRSNASEVVSNEGKPGFNVCNIESCDNTWQQASRFAVLNSNVKLPDNGPKFSSIDKTFEKIGEPQHSPKDLSHITSADSEAGTGGDLINILSKKHKYSSIWHLIYQQFISSEESMAGNQEVKSLNEHEHNQGAPMETVDFDQTAAVKLVQQALDGILQRDGHSSDQQIPSQETLLVTAVSSEENFSQTGVAIIEKPSLESECVMRKVEQKCEASQQNAKLNEGKIPGRNISKSLSKLRKLIVATKFIKSMENLKKISPGKPQYFFSELTEEERVYLRHLSMNERKYDEEWMLDFALRKAISRLGPDEQRRVALVVEAFEAVNPDNEEKSIKCYPMKRETVPGVELGTPVNEEAKPFVESYEEISISDEQDDEAQQYHKGILEERRLRGDHIYVTSATGDNLKEADEHGILLDSSENSTTSIETVEGIKESTRTLEAPSQFPNEDSEVNLAHDMSTVLLDQQKYTSMWNMIYQHITSNQSSLQGEQDANGGDANPSEEINNLDSTKSVYTTDHEEDEDNQSASPEKLELSQSAAIKLVKEAVNAILQRYEPSSDKQSIIDHNNATNDISGPFISTPPCSTDDSSREEVLEKTNDVSLQQTETNEPKEAPKKMSKSLSKLKKAILTAKFIKAMERLRKITPQKPRHLFLEAASEEERIYLRHLSMVGRKNSEEWMLDYALRQVVSKLAPDQQRRVALLVEAFETVNPEQKDKGTSYCTLKHEAPTSIRLENPMNKELKQFVDSEQGKSIFDEKNPRKQDDGSLIESNDQASIKVKEVITGDALTTTTSKATSLPPTGDSEVGTVGDLTTLLSDKQKYTNMWHLIYQHVVPSDTPTAGKQRDTEVNEDEQDEGEHHGQETNKLESDRSPEHTIQKDDANDQGGDCEHELNQSAAVKLVKEAIDAILKCHESKSHALSVQEHDLHNKAAAAFTEETSVGWKRVENNKSLEVEIYENSLVQKKVDANGLNHFQRKSSKSLSKLKKLFITAKFMKAMERMRRISPHRPRYLPHEAPSEEEKVNLRHQDINERRNNEEWMLDYALRKVISNLAPEQQRRVAMLVEAFETVTPEHKANGIVSHKIPEVVLTVELGSTANAKQITNSQCDNSTSYEDHICPCSSDEFSHVGTHIQPGPGEDHPMKISNFRTKSSEDIFHSDVKDLHIFHRSSSKGDAVSDQLNIPERKGIDSKSKSESFQEGSFSEDSKQEHEANIAKSIFSATQKQTSMWHLIYQHAKSVTTVEAGSIEHQFKTGRATSEITVDEDADESDTSSMTSELTETEAVKMVREALNDILSGPEELDNDLFSSNVTSANDEDQREGEAEKSTKTISRGYSKLRKLIICNKFIKAMEKAKKQKSYPQKCKHPILNSEPDAEKTHLKPCVMSEKKSKDELMLDHALQKAIAGLAPVQQRRVALLIEAFEKVSPDPEETTKGCSSSNTECLSSVGNAKGGNDHIFESSQSSTQLPGDFNLMIPRSVRTSGRKVVTGRTPEQIPKEKTPIVSREDWRNTSISSITAPIFDINDNPSSVCRDPAEFNAGDMQGHCIQQKEIVSTCANYSESTALTAEKPSQTEDLEDEENPSNENDSSMDKVRHTNLWCLLVQHVKSDIWEETTKMPVEIEANVLLRGNSNDQSKLSPEANRDDNMKFHMPKSVNFEIQEKEAIKVVEEALEAILNCDDQSMTASTSSDQNSFPLNDQPREEPSPAAQEIEGSETTVDTVANPEERQTSSQEKISNSYNKLSRVILCKRFIKAMDKMRKIKPQIPQYHSQQQQLGDEVVRPMRQTVSDQRKNWEEWMLDSAMQKVVGKLAPAQKKKVSLLVQAFEMISLQPEPDTGRRVKMPAL